MRMGISLYPHLFKNNFDITSYLKKIKLANINLIFTTLINLHPKNTEVVNLMQELSAASKDNNLKLYIDLNQTVLMNFGFNKEQVLDALIFFNKKFKISHFRCDEGIELEQIANATLNSLGLKLIINASESFERIKQLLSLTVNCNNLEACWNFYPQRYTGSSTQNLISKLLFLHQYNIKLQAFVSSQNPTATGPWLYNDKLPSLELHRDWPIDQQIRYLQSLHIDDVIVSNQFLDEAELLSITQIDHNILQIKISPVSNLTGIESKILYDENIHQPRVDKCEAMVRSTLSRLKYQDCLIAPNNYNIKQFQPGDVLILNSLSKNYQGELQIVLQPFANDKIRNLVGRLSPEELEIIKNINPEIKFKFI